MSTFTIYAASRAGSKHKHREEENQDAHAVLQENGNMYLALCDGAGSCRHSREGAELVCRLAVSFMAGMDWGLSFGEEAGRFLDRAREAVVLRAGELGLAPREFACTLLAVAVTRTGMRAMQLGDGFIVRQDSPETEYELVFSPTKGEYANETVFVVSDGAAGKLQVYETSEAPFFLCLSSDGIERQAIRFAENRPHPPFFEYLSRVMRADADGNAVFGQFLSMESMDEVTDDDRTLVCAMRRE